MLLEGCLLHATYVCSTAEVLSELEGCLLDCWDFVLVGGITAGE